ncbi:RagB/SusD family nutrient uptake outer membrane protein [Hymenobacter persicinus]|uniref:RagB/SusD family nutrient uptake outer membrane protein n=1 Tax=Hymenobacter persicinus TaxID=2025506 RepID=A0A4Q5LEB6_9BACT|nr:RagB/SusD family nutrient uptake outer membrane protein [Hymenobacter persicinus]RYU82470.1 RagB/SusD family nutrient uptake outer membrane protein [Hymenobacter persicinus]
MNRTITQGLTVASLTAALLFGTTSCMKDLDQEPKFGLNTATIYSNPVLQKQVLAKLYGGLHLTGLKPSDDPDPEVRGADQGATSYLRLLWKMEELTSDEAAVAWTDGSIQALNTSQWSSSNDFVQAMYDRIYFQIASTNEYIREMSDDKLSSRGITGGDLTNARYYRAEARFLRALSYYHALDMYGNVPFVTENDLPGKDLVPQQKSRAALFSYVETELKDIEGLMTPAHAAEYGRADQAAVWTLLAKLYLNAKVYTGIEHNADVITYCDKILKAGYTLAPEYRLLFLADNDVKAKNEIILPVVCDGTRSQSYGATTFLVHAASGGSLQPVAMGITNAWSGIRAKKNLPLSFGLSTAADAANPADKRAIFFTTRQNLEMNSLIVFRDGWAVTKFKNLQSDGKPSPTADPTGTFADTDFPLFRLGDVYLMYAEAKMRMGQTTDPTALNYVNMLRRRGYGFDMNQPNAVSDVSTLTEAFMLAERGREMYWEAQRRTDLIRFGVYTSSTYLWPWKGNVQAGTGLEPYRTLFPLPVSDLSANPSLKQNDGY